MILKFEIVENVTVIKMMTLMPKRKKKLKHHKISESDSSRDGAKLYSMFNGI